MQTAQAPWKAELAGILQEYRERDAAADDPGAEVRASMWRALGRLRDWMDDLPDPKTDKGRVRREELYRIFAMLDGVLDDL